MIFSLTLFSVWCKAWFTAISACENSVSSPSHSAINIVRLLVLGIWKLCFYVFMFVCKSLITNDTDFPKVFWLCMFPFLLIISSYPWLIFPLVYLSFFFFICGGFCHTLKWNSQGFTCVPHPNSPSHLPLHPFPLGFPSAPGPTAGLMHPTWAGDLFHPR